MSDDRLPCPIRGCTHTRRPEHAFCAEHWRAVAPSLRRAVISTWRTRRGARGTLSRARLGSGQVDAARLAYAVAMREHLQALENAQAWVEGRGARGMFVGLEAQR